jgi:hypothetical protein
MAAAYKKTLANKAKLAGALNSALTSRFETRPPDIASAYRKHQQDWKASYLAG